MSNPENDRSILPDKCYFRRSGKNINPPKVLALPLCTGSQSGENVIVHGHGLAFVFIPKVWEGSFGLHMTPRLYAQAPALSLSSFEGVEVLFVAAESCRLNAL